MKPQATGTLECVDGQSVLVLVRTFQASLADVWASLTESERTARWIGPWAGKGAPGETLTLTMIAEEGSPDQSFKLVECEPMRRVVVQMGPPDALWTVEVNLSESDGITELELRQPLMPGQHPGDMGSGWEFYLDRFTAAREGKEAAPFEEYHPGQLPHYQKLHDDLVCPE